MLLYFDGVPGDGSFCHRCYLPLSRLITFQANHTKATTAHKAKSAMSFCSVVIGAIDREAKRAYNTRSIVLLLVVLAVVLMPIVAIIAGLSPQDFGSYIAPVTAIAGTVVGHWFGERGRTATGD
jgi:hypothetical protein